MFPSIVSGRYAAGSVRVDRETRAIGRFPMVGDFLSSSDDSLESLEEAIALNEDEATIAELMHREVHVVSGGSRGSRRRRHDNPLRGGKIEGGSDDGGECLPRIGRPTVGAEVRVRVQTSITERTREMLRKYGVTLAEIFDVYARRLVPHGI